jgi:hypothetical protein
VVARWRIVRWGRLHEALRRVCLLLQVLLQELRVRVLDGTRVRQVSRSCGGMVQLLLLLLGVQLAALLGEGAALAAPLSVPTTCGSAPGHR